MDAEREGNVVRVVMTPFQSACYEFVNEDPQNELDIDTHIRTSSSCHSSSFQFCAGSRFFWSSPLPSAFSYSPRSYSAPFPPSSWKYFIIVLLSLFFLLGLHLTLNSYLLATPFFLLSLLTPSWYANNLFVPLVLPLLRVCCKLILGFLHVALRYGFFSSLTQPRPLHSSLR